MKKTISFLTSLALCLMPLAGTVSNTVAADDTAVIAEKEAKYCEICGDELPDDALPSPLGLYICSDCREQGMGGTTTGTSTTITTTTTTDTELPAPNGSCGDDLTWRLDGDTLVISGKGAMDNFPFGSPFLDLKYKEVIFPDALTSIGVNAFANSGLPIEPQNGLERAEIPDSVTSIGDWAFYGCIDLAEVTIPESVTTIGNEVFKNCPKLTLKGYTGSYAETYAKENDIPFEAISETTDTTTTTTTTTTVESTDTETTTSYIRSTPVGGISADSLPDEVLMQSGEEMTLNFMGMYIIGVKAVSSDETIVKAEAEIGSGMFLQSGTLTLKAGKTDKTKTAEVEFFYDTFIAQDGGSKVIKVTVAGEKDEPVDSTDQSFVNELFADFKAGAKNALSLRHYLAQDITFTSDCEYLTFVRSGYNEPGVVQYDAAPNVIVIGDSNLYSPNSATMYVYVDENAPTGKATVNMSYTSLSTGKEVKKSFDVDILSKEDAGQTTTTTSSVITTTTTTQPSTDALHRVGDSNCDGQCNMADAVFIMQCIANPDKYQLTERGRAQADVDRSGDITNKDALTIQKFKLHIIDNFS